MSKRAAEAVEIGEVVPIGEAFDVRVHAAAKERNEVDRFFRADFRRMELMERLEPEQGELDGMFAVVGFVKEVAGGVGLGREGVDEFGRADGASQRRDVIAPVEIPFEVRAVADAEDNIGVGGRGFEKGTKGGGVGAEADTKVDVGGDYAKEGTFLRCGGQLVRGAGGEGVAEKSEGFDGVGGIAVRVMLGGEGGHGSVEIKKAFCGNLQAFSSTSMKVVLRQKIIRLYNYFIVML